MVKTQAIPWKDFADKHKAYVRAGIDQRMSVAEGAIRSGKTIDNCIIAAAHLELCADRLHLASAATVAAAKTIIGDCNGFGLEHLFRGRCRWGKFRDNPALTLQTQTGEKVVVFMGGAKADSYKRIVGMSFGLWIATEIDLHYDSEDSRESFVKVAFGRQAAAVQPMTLWDLNPCTPGHKIYRDYIDAYKAGFAGGYNYQHFTIADNLSVTPQRRAEIESRYTPGSVWHRRDILGERCVAEGLIYHDFADDPARWLREIPKRGEATDLAHWERERPWDFIQVGVDFGGNRSAFAFVACGLRRDYATLTALRSERHPATGVTPERMYALLEAFIARVRADWGEVAVIYADSAEQTLINGMRGRLDVPVRNSVKNPIMDRVRGTLALMANGERFGYTADCESLRRALAGARYDPGKPGHPRLEDARLDDGSSDIDTLDAFEYAFERYLTGYMRYYGWEEAAGAKAGGNTNDRGAW